jgi:hypothetical protein
MGYVQVVEGAYVGLSGESHLSEKIITWMAPQEISFSLLNILSVIHHKWTVDSGVFISLLFYPKISLWDK